MPATREEWLELVSPKHTRPNNNGDPRPIKMRNIKIRALVREYLTDHWVEDISTPELLEALFPERWVLSDLNNPVAEIAKSVIAQAISGFAGRAEMKGCYRQREGDTLNKWGYLPYVWSTPCDPPKPVPEPTPAKCCPTCGKAL